MNQLPRHIAFIMDGNGRWASARGLARKFGHEAGAKAVMRAVERCAELGIKVVSFYAFSTENWGRSEEEVKGIFDIARGFSYDKLIQNGVRVVTMGDVTKFPKDLQDKLAEVIAKTKDNTKITVNLCINYGGRAEIIRAVNNAKKPVTEESFKEYLYGADLPDPDFIVRTSGEQRISNFMLYQMAYAELYFPKLFWPNVNAKFIDRCVAEFQKRKRRFGK